MPRPPLPPFESYPEVVERLLLKLKRDLVSRHEAELSRVRRTISDTASNFLENISDSVGSPGKESTEVQSAFRVKSGTINSVGDVESAVPKAIWTVPALNGSEETPLKTVASVHSVSCKTARVTIVSAHGLENEDWYSLSDPFCKVQILGRSDTSQTTRAVKDSLEPAWNETFELECMDNDDLEFSVFDKDTICDDLLGRAVLSANDYFRNGFSGSLTLQQNRSLGYLRVVVEIEDVDKYGDDIAIFTAYGTSTASKLSQQSSAESLYSFPPSPKTANARKAAKAKKQGTRTSVHGETLYSTLVEDYRESLPNPPEIAGNTNAQIRDIVMCVIVLANAVIESLSIQHTSQTGEEFSWSPLCTKIFCAIFLVDLIEQLWTHRKRCAFCNDRILVFDMITVAMMVVEVVLDALGTSGALLSTAGVFRIFRAARILRILRIFKVLSYASDVMCLVDCIGRCALSLFWLVLLGFMLLLMIAHVFTFGASKHCAGSMSNDSVCEHFGSLWHSCVSLFKAMLGGMLWGVLYDDLEAIGSFYQLCLSLYMSFIVVLYFNVTIGITVYSWAEASKQHLNHIIKDVMQHESDLCKVCTDLFNEIDINSSGGLTYDELLYAVRNPRLRAWLTSMDIDCHSLRKVYKILDDRAQGLVNQEEFVLGCLLLHGSAKKVDVVSLQKDLVGVVTQMEGMQQKVDRICISLQCNIAEDEHDIVDLPKRMVSDLSTAFAERNSYSYGILPDDQPSITPIEKAEMRSMLLHELIGVVALIMSKCKEEGWTDPSTGAVLQPSSVNLYQFSYNYMCPRTVPSGILLTGLRAIPYACGQLIVQSDGVKSIAEGLVQTSNDGDIHVLVTRGRFRRKEEIEFRVSVDGEDCGVPDEVRHTDNFSYKELVSSAPTPPDWFCSHWWGECIKDFVDCCEEHAKLQRSDKKRASYWVCAYANRQHDLGLDIGEDLDSTSFMRAMRKSKGTLLLLDPEATAFSRIWCCYEIYETVCDQQRTLDIVTMKGKPQLLTETTLPGERAFEKTLREEHFPLKLLARGLTVKLQEGNASVEKDKAPILLRMCRMIGGDESTTTPEIADDETLRRKSVSKANKTLRAFFALVAWPQAVKSGLVANFPRIQVNKRGEETMALNAILRKDLGRTVLTLNFASMKEMTDEHVKALGEGLPPNLRTLVLSFESCKSISHDGLRGLVTNLRKLPLTSIDLDFTGCKLLNDTSVQALAEHLPTSLEDVRLVFHLCTHISEVGVHVLAAKLPPRINKITACFTGTKCDRNFTTPKSLQQFAKKLVVRD